MAKTVKVRDINLLLAMDRGVKKSKGSGAKFLPLLMIVAAVVAIAAAMVFFYMQNSDLKSQIEEINLYLNDETTKSAAADSIAAQTMAGLMSSLNQSLEKTVSDLSSYPQISGEQIDRIYTFAGNRVQIDDNFSFDNSTGRLDLSVTSDTAAGVPIFVSQLRASGMFEEVTYQGYQETSTSSEGPQRTDPVTGESVSTTVTTSAYHFTVSCMWQRPTPISFETPAATGGGATAEGGQ
ncbi:MAG: hypothetical protein LBK04_01355 [Clostridiales Family XIII bacterium]|nr:hypothetical protein [Clostridiales Family XIII bacterium]